MKKQTELTKIQWNNSVKKIVDNIEKLVNIPSPAGMTTDVIHFVKKQMESMKYPCIIDSKGMLTVRLQDGKKERLAIVAHVDTLGAMVSGIKPDGFLEFSSWGLSPFALIRENVTVFSSNNKKYRGSIVPELRSAHAHKSEELKKSATDSDSLIIRLDQEIQKKEDLKKLGIEIGDYIALDPCFEKTDTGYVKSRFLDDKASAGILMELAVLVFEKKLKLNRPVDLIFTVHEEIGHGGAPLAHKDYEELLIVDMGVVGKGLTGNETSVSICVKDSSGPYSPGLSKKLGEICKKEKIPYNKDVFPFYGSDASATMRAGGVLETALIGPGVDFSHSYERTHQKGLEATLKLLWNYIK